MQIFVHSSFRTSGALAKGTFSLTWAHWAHAGSKYAAWILVACRTGGSFGSVWDFDEPWTVGRRPVWAGRGNEALDRAWDEGWDGHQVEIRRQRTALRIGRKGVFRRHRVGGSYTWLCAICWHFRRCVCRVGVLFCTTGWRGCDRRGRRGWCRQHGSRLDWRGRSTVLDLDWLWMRCNRLSCRGGLLSWRYSRGDWRSGRLDWLGFWGQWFWTGAYFRSLGHLGSRWGLWLSWKVCRWLWGGRWHCLFPRTFAILKDGQLIVLLNVWKEKN